MADAIRSKTFWTLIGAISFALFSIAGTGAVMGNEVGKQGTRIEANEKQLETVKSDHDALLVLTGTVGHLAEAVEDLQGEVKAARAAQTTAFGEIMTELQRR